VLSGLSRPKPRRWSPQQSRWTCGMLFTAKPTPSPCTPGSNLLLTRKPEHIFGGRPTKEEGWSSILFRDKTNDDAFALSTDLPGHRRYRATGVTGRNIPPAAHRLDVYRSAEHLVVPRAVGHRRLPVRARPPPERWLRPAPRRVHRGGGFVAIEAGGPYAAPNGTQWPSLRRQTARAQSAQRPFIFCSSWRPSASRQSFGRFCRPCKSLMSLRQL
jgi:hypothetical protein